MIRLFALLMGMGFLLPVAQAQRYLRISPLVETLRETPVFKMPSAKAPVLADAQPRTPLLVRALSSKGTWLLVEDEDANRGWVPTGYTDFSALGSDPWELNAPAAPKMKSAPNIFTPETPVGEDSAAAPMKPEGTPFFTEDSSRAPAPQSAAYSEHQIGALGSATSADGVGLGGGASYAFLPKANQGQEQYGFWVAGLKRAEQWELPLRFAGRTMSEDGRWSRGPDVELRYLRRARQGDWVLGLGYSGAVLLAAQLFVLGRAGLSFNDGAQGELGLQLGWNL